VTVEVVTLLEGAIAIVRARNDLEMERNDEVAPSRRRFLMRVTDITNR
jgi:hypothetical protein